MIKVKGQIFDAKQIDAMQKRFTGAAMKATEWTAIDIASAAKRSIKAGGKSKKSKNYQVSKPGEPPRSHRGTLKKAIRYQKADERTYVVGAEKTGSSTVLNALEHGGESSSRQTIYSDEYVQRIARQRRRADKTRVRPLTKRKYTLYTKSRPNGLTVSEYVRFWTTDSWERARQSVRFQEWGREQKTSAVTKSTIQARPFMGPALQKAASQRQINARLTRALNNG